MPRKVRRAPSRRAAVESRSRIDDRENGKKGRENAEPAGKKIHVNKVRKGKKLINAFLTF